MEKTASNHLMLKYTARWILAIGLIVNLTAVALAQEEDRFEESGQKFQGFNLGCPSCREIWEAGVPSLRNWCAINARLAFRSFVAFRTFGPFQIRILTLEQDRVKGFKVAKTRRVTLSSMGWLLLQHHDGGPYSPWLPMHKWIDAWPYKSRSCFEVLIANGQV